MKAIFKLLCKILLLYELFQIVSHAIHILLWTSNLPKISNVQQQIILMTNIWFLNYMKFENLHVNYSILIIFLFFH